MRALRRVLAVVLRPIILPVMVNYMLSLMWAIGINQSSAVLFLTPQKAGGYGLTLWAVGYLTFAPILGVFIGEILGHWGNEWIAKRYVERHGGLFKPEARLAAIYPATVLMVSGVALVGQALGHRLHWAAIAFGWAMYVTGYMILSVAVTAYVLDAYPSAPGELSALLNLARILGGFSVGYFQLDWGTAVGFDESFGVQAAIIGAAQLILIGLHFYGEKLRSKGGPL